MKHKSYGENHNSRTENELHRYSHFDIMHMSRADGQTDENLTGWVYCDTKQPLISARFMF